VKDKIDNLKNKITGIKIKKSYIILAFAASVIIAAVLLDTIFTPGQITPEKPEPVPSVSLGCDLVLWKDMELEISAATRNIDRPSFNWTLDENHAGNSQKLKEKLDVGEHQVLLNVAFDDTILTAKQTTYVIDSMDSVSVHDSAASKNQWGFQTMYLGKKYGVKGVTVSVDSSPHSQVNNCGSLSTKPLMAGDHTWEARYQGNIIASGTFSIKEVNEVKITGVEVASSYNAGDTVHGKIVVKNTGSAVVREFDIKTLVVNNNYAWMGDKAKRDYFDQYSSDLKPGEVYEVPITVTIPEKVSGIRPSGRYSITVSLLLDGKTMDTRLVNTQVK
jgi:hypothetical protein